MRARLPSMADVATAAGVSGQTVSRVVNAHANVDPQTRERVLAAMASVGYRPQRAARALRTGRSQTVGVIVATLASVGNSRLVEEVTALAGVRGLAVVLATLDTTLDDPLDAALDALVAQGVDGVIVVNDAVPYATADIAAPVPIVLVDGADDQAHTVVRSDHRGGARAITDLLLAGRSSADAGSGRTVHHVAGPASAYPAGEREAGWRSALAAVGAAAHEPLRGDWTAESGYVIGQVLADDAGVTAVFAANDQLALGVMRALHEAGRRIPEDVAVAGFDGITDGAQFWPPLTTAAQDFAALAAAALDAFERSDAASERAVVVPASVVIRASTR